MANVTRKKPTLKQLEAIVAKQHEELEALKARGERPTGHVQMPTTLTRTYVTDAGEMDFEFDCVKGMVKTTCNGRTSWLRKTDFDVLMHVMRSEHIDDLYPLVSTHVRDITKKAKKVSKKRTRKARK